MLLDYCGYHGKICQFETAKSIAIAMKSELYIDHFCQLNSLGKHSEKLDVYL